MDRGVGQERWRDAGFHHSRCRQSTVVHQVRSARLARNGHGQRDRGVETVLGGWLPHRRVPHRSARAVEPGDRKGHARYARRRNAAAHEPGRHQLAAVARRSRPRRLLPRDPEQGRARPPGRPHQVPRHARGRSERHRAARTSPRAARLFRVCGMAEPRRRERHQLAIDVDYGKQAELHSQLLARLRIRARQRSRGSAGRMGRLRSARRGTGRDRQAHAGARPQHPGVAHAGVFRIAGDRPAAPRSLEVESRGMVAAHHQRGVPPHEAGRHVLGRDETRVDH